MTVGFFTAVIIFGSDECINNFKNLSVFLKEKVIRRVNVIGVGMTKFTAPKALKSNVLSFLSLLRT